MFCKCVKKVYTKMLLFFVNWNLKRQWQFGSYVFARAKERKNGQQQNNSKQVVELRKKKKEAVAKWTLFPSLLACIR